MKRIVLTLVVLMLGASTLAFGWGNATHVYLANRLGSKMGPVNLQEMYGSLTPDLFNYMFDARGQTLAYFAHYQPEALYAAASGAEQKAVAFGFMSHNNVYGADITAHGSPNSPNPLWPSHKLGFAVKYGNVEAMRLIAPLKAILAAGGVPDAQQEDLALYLAPIMGHDLVETAVDILIKRNQDPLVGLRMYVAAKARTPETGPLLANAYAELIAQYTNDTEDPTDDIDAASARELIIGAEAVYQGAMADYGQAFMLPEKQMIPLLAQQSAAVAGELISITVAQLTGEPGGSFTVSPALVQEQLTKCIALVKNVYGSEIERTYDLVNRQLALHHIRTVPFCAMLGKQADPAESQVEETVAPASFGLEQNFPNPFNPSTQFGYRIAESGLVKLAVYNMLGQEVAVLVNEAKEPGVYQVRWDASGMPSGTYLYRLEAGGSVSTKRMTFVK